MMRTRFRAGAVAAWLALSLSGCGGAADGGEQHEHDHAAGHVELTAAQAQAAGVTTAPAGPGTVRRTLQLAARVARDENAIVHVNPRVAGAVTAIHKGHGEHVVAGEVLAELWSAELGAVVAEGLVARTKAQAAEETLAKTSALFARRLEALTRVLDAEIAAAERVVEREQELQQKSLSTLRPYLEAERDLQRARLGRERELTTLEAERDTALLALEVGLRETRIDERAAHDRLRALGLAEPDIDELFGAEGRYGRLTIRAPRAGFVAERHITHSEHVTPETKLFEIEDHATVWVLASVYEQDLAAVREGQKVQVTVAALPGDRFAGAVDHIDHHVGVATRAALARIVMPNPEIEGSPGEFVLRPGMFATVELEIGVREARVVVPETAVVREGTRTYLFVRAGDDAFERRPVEISAGADGVVELLSGVEPGEQIAVTGTFALKSLARREEIGGHGH